MIPLLSHVTAAHVSEYALLPVSVPSPVTVLLTKSIEPEKPGFVHVHA